ncbi:hypothetical protein ACW5W8_22495 [Aeromonas aquatilis]
MENYLAQLCPLCEIQAKYCKVDFGNVKYFNCPNCGLFQISTAAEKRLDQEFPHRKMEYSAQAQQTPKHHLLFIGLPSHEFQQHSNDRLQAEFSPKSELDLKCR